MKKSQKQWAEEARFCEARANDKSFGYFNHDAQCFGRYCKMQATAAREDGMDEIARRIEECANV